VGSLSLSPNAPTYIDANILIYSVERVMPYTAQLAVFWRQAQARRLVVVTSELTTLEALVGPMKAGNQKLEARFRRALFASTNLSLLPITRDILERAAHLRATHPGLKTPDAIHAATALDANCAQMLTNDPAFRQIAGLTVIAPQDLASP
jgi:predicted nucleic acid-binding protein